MTEAELVTEIEGENRAPKAPPALMDSWSAKDEALATAQTLLASASVMLTRENARNLRSEILARLSAVTTLVASL